MSEVWIPAGAVLIAAGAIMVTAGNILLGIWYKRTQNQGRRR